MLTNAQQNIKNSLYNAILTWFNDNNEEMCSPDCMPTLWGQFIIELMTDSAFNVMLAQLDMTRYYKENKTDFKV